MVLAIGRHRAYVTGWATAAVVVIAVASFLVPLPVVGRALVALYAGPYLRVRGASGSDEDSRPFRAGAQ